MAFSTQPLFLFFLLLSISSISHSADLITKECGKTPSSNDTLQANINTVILDLVTKTSANGFANSTYGLGADTVYGIAECRVDIAGDECSKCIIDAGQELRTSCGNTTESHIWCHQCSVHYSTTNFIGQADTDKVGVWTSSSKMEDPNSFKKILMELIAVVGIAGSNGENRKFGWGQTENQNQTVAAIYGMAQCSWDLQALECRKCLDAAYKILTSECGELDGCFIIAKSCAIRYEMSSFLFTNAAANATATTRKISFANI